MTPREEREQQLQKQAELCYNNTASREAFMSGARWADHTAPKVTKSMELNALRKQLIDIAGRLDFLYGIRLSNARFDYTDGSVSGIRFIYSEWDIRDYKRIVED